MLKQLLLIPIIALSSICAQAQFRYAFKDTTTPYTPLTGATSLNGSLIWDEDLLTAPLPFTWKMDSTIATTKFHVVTPMPGVLADTMNTTDLNGFFLGDIDAADRGLLAGSASLSPIRYTTTGTAPNRIFKVEFFNAGFYQEYDLYSTMADSFNMQMWVYETKNIVELHFGPSRITHASDYWGYNLGATGPLFGYLKHVDFDGFTGGSIYHLKGSPTAPGIDTIKIPPGSTSPVGLNSWPANGEVYRFTPKSVCNTPTANLSAGTPSGKTVQYTYTGSTTGLDSLVWNFGDGQKQKVTTGFTTPLSHTFASNGNYTVSVTAYNSCGGNTFSKPLALTIGNLASLGDVKVYPNPATGLLIIEGMKVGDKASVVSVTGQQLMTSTIDNKIQVLNIAALPAGTYILLLSGRDNGTGAVTFIKQ